MAQVKIVRIGDTDVFVEVEPLDLIIPNRSTASPLPPGAEAVGFQDRLHDAANVIRDTVASLTETLRSGLTAVQPDEWTLELGMAFKGEVNPIPVLVKTGAEATLKITVKWKRST